MTEIPDEPYDIWANARAEEQFRLYCESVRKETGHRCSPEHPPCEVCQELYDREDAILDSEGYTP